jgi:Na+/melibiose symporter-like transporter
MLMSDFRSPFADARSEPAPSVGRLLRFSAITIPLYAAAMPAAVYLPAIYARDFGIPLAMIGALFLVGQIANIVLDPLTGTLSDRTRSRFGRRKPWVAAGGVLFTLGGALLFFPPATVSPLYLGAALVLFNIGWAALQTPFLAWSGEITGQYHQRTRIQTYQTVVTAATLFVALILPTIVDQLRPADGRLQLTLMGGQIVLTAVPALLLTLTSFREPSTFPPVVPFSFRQSLRAVFANPLLLRVLFSDAAVRGGQGIRGVLMVFFVSTYMQRPEWAAGLFLFQYVFGILAGPIWQRISARIGKHRAAVAGELVQVAINLGLLLATPENFGFVLVLAAAQGLAQGSGNLMLRAMVADIADKHRYDTGEERTGLYYSVFTLSEKAGGALAIGIALPLVAWFGFDPKHANSPAALSGLLYVFALGPAIAHAISAALVARFPLDEAAHSEIRRQLEAGPTVLAPAE